MIHIDFQAGAHGNYLEFVCNKIAGLTLGTPFHSNGAAHTKLYIGEKMFEADHYSFDPIPFYFDKIISIHIEKHNLLPVQQISLLRANNYGFDNDQLEHDTYNKLNNIHYRHVLDQIIENFFTNHIQESYNAVKDSSWPDINTVEEFQRLPEWIKNECINIHKFKLLDLSPTHPNCSRAVLREFFQIGFEFPEQSGFIVRQQNVKYDSSKQVYVFPFECFYDKNSFLQEIRKVADWSNISYTCQDDIGQLHDEFLQRQPYKNSKHKCNEIISKIRTQQAVDQKVDLLEEAYINAKLGWNYFV